MKILLVHTFLFLTFALAGCSRGIHSASGGWPPAASPTPAAISSSSQVVKLSTSAIAIGAGGDGNASVHLSISPGFHVNANPATFSYLIATEVQMERTAGLTAGKPMYPAAEKREFQFAEQPLAVYEGETQINLPLHADSGASKGVSSLLVHVRVQACDNEKCYPPATVDIAIKVDVK